MRRAVSPALVLAGALLHVGCSDGSSQNSGARVAGPETPCVEELTPITVDQQTPLGYTAREMLGFVGGERAAPLAWTDGSTTSIAVSVNAPAAFLVASRPNPNYRMDLGYNCADHIRLRADVNVRTDDGRVDELLAALDLDALRVDQVGAKRNVTRDALQSPYAAGLPAGQCLVALQFNLWWTSTGIRGDLFQTVAWAACPAESPITATSAGAW